MTEKEISQVFSEIQQRLDSMQEEEATFLFIGHEGNHFVMGGNPVNISAQIVFSMIRYPIIRQIIKRCAERFDEAYTEYGEEIKSVKMDHLIERNSGN